MLARYDDDRDRIAIASTLATSWCRYCRHFLATSRACANRILEEITIGPVPAAIRVVEGESRCGSFTPARSARA